MARKNIRKKTVLPDPLPKGEVLTDIAKKTWVLGPSIGVGGFGEIYSAAAGGRSSKDYQYVVKIEPHGNGPLFCEMHFFMRNSKSDMIKAWCKQKHLKFLGMPEYLGSGSHTYNDKKYRFLVMDKYGKDIWHIFCENNRKFPSPTVYRIAIQLLDVLEYIHANGYVHADIKGSNILTSRTKADEEQVYLVDFGLASHFSKKEYKPDPKKAHNGTIEYTSRDAHAGIATRRGDLEILAYNMIQWMGCKLPWEDKITDPVAVHKSKTMNMEDIMGFTKLCFGAYTAPAALIEFLVYIKQMQYNTEPNYKLIRGLFLSGLNSSGGTLTGTLEFKTTKSKESSCPTPKKLARLTLEPIDTKKRGGRPPTKSLPPTTATDSEHDTDDAPLERRSVNTKKEMSSTKTPRKKSPIKISPIKISTGKKSPKKLQSESEPENDEDISLKERSNAQMKKIAGGKSSKLKHDTSETYSTNVDDVSLQGTGYKRKKKIIDYTSDDVQLESESDDDEDISLQKRSNAEMRKITPRKSGRSKHNTSETYSTNVDDVSLQGTGHKRKKKIIDYTSDDVQLESESDDDEDISVQERSNAEMKKITPRKPGKPKHNTSETYSTNGDAATLHGTGNKRKKKIIDDTSDDVQLKSKSKPDEDISLQKRYNAQMKKKVGRKPGKSKHATSEKYSTNGDDVSLKGTGYKRKKTIMGDMSDDEQLESELGSDMSKSGMNIEEDDFIEDTPPRKTQEELRWDKKITSTDKKRPLRQRPARSYAESDDLE